MIQDIIHIFLSDMLRPQAREDLEKKTGKRVVSRENYLTQPVSRKRLERK